MLSNATKVLVADMTHGGTVLAEEFSLQGFEVYGYDCHKTLTSEIINYLEERGIHIIRNDQELMESLRSMDLIAVQHLHRSHPLFAEATKLGIPVITHAKTVGLLLKNQVKDTLVVEVTGSYGKTSVVNMVAHTLFSAGIPTLLSDSRGFFALLGKSALLSTSNTSITPASVISAWRWFHSACGASPKVAVFEISLGGTGLADVGIVTNVKENYAVGFWGSAFNAKLQMAEYLSEHSVLVLNGDDPLTRRMKHLTRAKTAMFSVANASSCQVCLKDLRYSLNSGYHLEVVVNDLPTTTGHTLEEQLSLKLNERLFGLSHVENSLAALASLASLELVDLETIPIHLASFTGIDGRAVLHRISSKIPLVYVSSDGLGPASLSELLRNAAEVARNSRRKLVLLLGGGLKSACLHVDAQKIAQVVKKYQPCLEQLILYGDLGRALVGEGLKGQLEEQLFMKEILSQLSPHEEWLVVLCNFGQNLKLEG